jgi:hypothetical protein
MVMTSQRQYRRKERNIGNKLQWTKRHERKPKSNHWRLLIGNIFATSPKKSKSYSTHCWFFLLKQKTENQNMLSKIFKHFYFILLLHKTKKNFAKQFCYSGY